MPFIINIVGIGRKSGKTSLIEDLTRHLTEIGFRVWTMKHISTSFDTIGKDTWRHLRAGASTVMAITPNELISIQSIQDLSLDNVLKEIPEDVDLVIVEGFKGSNLPKIITVRNICDAERLLDQVKNVFAIAGSIVEEEEIKSIAGVPILGLDELVLVVKQKTLGEAIKRLPGVNCKHCGYESCESLAEAILRGEASIEKCITLHEGDVLLKVNGERVFLGKFPSKIIKNTFLGMIKSLKGVDTKGANSISFELTLSESKT